MSDALTAKQLNIIQEQINRLTANHPDLLIELEDDGLVGVIYDKDDIYEDGSVRIKGKDISNSVYPRLLVYNTIVELIEQIEDRVSATDIFPKYDRDLSDGDSYRLRESIAQLEAREEDTSSVSQYLWQHVDNGDDNAVIMRADHKGTKLSIHRVGHSSDGEGYRLHAINDMMEFSHECTYFEDSLFAADRLFVMID